MELYQGLCQELVITEATTNAITTTPGDIASNCL